MNGVRYISTPLLLCVMLLVVGCTGEPSAVRETEGGGDVRLSLSVSVGNSRGPGETRVDPFQPTEDPYELIHTLRIIIVRQDNTVEYNRLMNMPPGMAFDHVGAFEFDVSTSLGEIVRAETGSMSRTEKKRIYLVANEASIPNDYVRDMLENLKGAAAVGEDAGTDYAPGDKFLPSVAEGIIIWNEWIAADETLKYSYAVPMIDNAGAEKMYVPMTEFFNIDVTSYFSVVTVDSDKPAGRNVQRENLFVTRNPVKFQFEIDDEAMPDMESFKVTDITFSTLRQKEYLFPNGMVYSPGKYNADGSVNIEDKEIIKYNIPGLVNTDNMARPYIFRPKNFGYNNKISGSLPTHHERVYNPPLYFCESKTLVGEEDNPGLTKFTISVGLEFDRKDQQTDDDGNPVVDEDGNPVYMEPVRMEFKDVDLNLPEMLPRNTIVKVKMSVSKGELNCVATVYPYTAVVLDPSFGFDIEAESITIDPEELTLEVEKMKLLITTIYPEDTIDRILTWSCSDDTVVWLRDGYVWGLKPGTAVVTVSTSNGKTASCRVTVVEKSE